MSEAGVVLSLMSAIFWGINAFFMKKALAKTDFLVAAFLSVLAGAISVTVVWTATEKTATFSFNDMAVFLIAGIINFSIFNICYIYGIRRIGLSRATPISSSYVIFTTIFAVTILGEKLTAGIIIGVILLFLGITLLGVRKLSEGLKFSEEIVYILLAAILLSLYPVLIRAALEGAAYSFLEGLFFAIWAGALSNLAFVLISRKSKFVITLKKTTIYYIIGAGLTSAAANLCYYSALSSTPVVIVNPLSSFYPLIAIGLGLLFVEETITKQTIIGVVVIFLGICSVIL